VSLVSLYRNILAADVNQYRNSKGEVGVKELLIDTIPSAIGDILVITDEANLCALEFGDCRTRIMKFLEKRFGQITLNTAINPLGISERIQAYLRGEYNSLDGIPISLGGTTFQQQVWLMLRTIPTGTVLTYGQLAERLGKPTASRAVGLANSQNPISIVLPCHRVIGANGQLTGYAGGLERKRWLLAHEGVTFGESTNYPMREQEIGEQKISEQKLGEQTLQLTLIL
jgi:methylated-DNA-[protein]-cysteine S-methyltransferase